MPIADSLCQVLSELGILMPSIPVGVAGRSPEYNPCTLKDLSVIIDKGEWHFSIHP